MGDQRRSSFVRWAKDGGSGGGDRSGREVGVALVWGRSEICWQQWWRIGDDMMACDGGGITKAGGV